VADPDTCVTQNTSCIEIMDNMLDSTTIGNTRIKHFHANSELADS
jgi:hypothetical protein